MKEQVDKKTLFPSLTWTQAGLVVFMALAGFVLVREYWTFIVGALPYLILLLCPLMHVFMHRGHGRHGKDDDHH